MAETKINKVTKSTTAVGGTTNLQWITKSQAIYTGDTGGGGGTTGDGSGEVAEVNGETLEFKASSSGTDIVLNSNEEATQVLTNIKQGDTVYSVPQGGSAGSSDIYKHSVQIMSVDRTNLIMFSIGIIIYSSYSKQMDVNYFRTNYQNESFMFPGASLDMEQKINGIVLTFSCDNEYFYFQRLDNTFNLTEYKISDEPIFQDSVAKI